MNAVGAPARQIYRNVRNHVVSQHHLPYRPNNSTPRHLPKRNKNLFLLKHLYKNVHSSFICNSQKLETAEVSTNRTMETQTVVHGTKGDSLAVKMEWNTMHAIIWVSLKSTVLSERNLTQKCANCTTPFINILEQAKLIYSGKRSEQWLPLGVWEQGMVGKSHEGIF